LLCNYVALKRKNFAVYKKALSDTRCTLLDEPAFAHSNKWFYAVFCRDTKEKNRILKHLNRKGVQARPLWFLNHLQKPYAHCQTYAIEKAPHIYDTLVNIPCSVSLTENEIREVVKAMKEVL
jgi:perosamine synthetase